MGRSFMRSSSLFLAFFAPWTGDGNARREALKGLPSLRIRQAERSLLPPIARSTSERYDGSKVRLFCSGSLGNANNLSYSKSIACLPFPDEMVPAGGSGAICRGGAAASFRKAPTERVFSIRNVLFQRVPSEESCRGGTSVARTVNTIAEERKGTISRKKPRIRRPIHRRRAAKIFFDQN